MPLVLRHSVEAVRKAMPQPNWMWQQRLTSEFLGRWRRGFSVAVKRLQNEVERHKIERALREGTVGSFVDTISFAEAFENPLLAEWSPILEAVMTASGAVAVAQIRAAMRFDLENPYTAPWLKAHAADLVREVSSETKLALRHVLVDAYEHRYPVDKIVDRIYNMVGLTERESVAVENYWARLAGDGTLTDEQVARYTDKYAEKLRHARAERIARHETNAASNRALADSWKVARDKGYIDPEAVRVWTAAPESPRTCEICLALDGKQAPLDGVFECEYGQYEGPPDPHVGCRCSVSLYVPGPKR